MAIAEERKGSKALRFMKRRMSLLLCLILTSMLLVSCGINGGSDEFTLDDYIKVEPEETERNENGQITKDDCAQQEISSEENMEPEGLSKAHQYLEVIGMTLETRILVPEGYERVPAEDDSLAEFLRNYSLKENGSPVLLYDGSEKRNQQAHVAVFALPIEDQDLQQCADSVMRAYAEYYWGTEQFEKIQFHFTNGFLAEYVKWREGYRVSVDGNNVSWVKSAGYDDSYETFVKYMRIVFTYAGTLSMEQESEIISVEEARVGDVFLKGGSPGHVVMIVDMCENEQGKKAFLLAQGYMPAQEFHVLKNPLHEDDPWYYEEELSGSIRTPEYSFGEGCLKRLEY